MYNLLRIVAEWSAGRRTLLRVALGAAVLAIAIVLFSSDLIDRAIDGLPRGTEISLIAFFVVIGVGGLAGQALHIAHWFASDSGKTSQPLIDRMHPRARPAIVLLILLGLIPPLGALYLAFFFLSILAW